MKTAIRISSLVIVVVMLATVLASCGGLSGTYSNTEEYMGIESGVRLKFSGNKIEMTIIILGQESDPIEGTYKINGDKIALDFDIENEDIEEYLGDLSGEADFEKGDGYIKIDGVKYTQE